MHFCCHVHQSLEAQGTPWCMNPAHPPAICNPPPSQAAQAFPQGYFGHPWCWGLGCWDTPSSSDALQEQFWRQLCCRGVQRCVQDQGLP